jgi:hypothetical protein
MATLISTYTWNGAQLIRRGRPSITPPPDPDNPTYVAYGSGVYGAGAYSMMPTGSSATYGQGTYGSGPYGG